MNTSLGPLFSGILISLLIIGLGALLSHLKSLNVEVTTAINRLIVDLTFPLMIYTQLIKSTTTADLIQDWPIPIIGGLIYLLGLFVGVLLTILMKGKVKDDHDWKPTFIFLTATPNWIFLPLVILENLLGETGIRIVLLYNIGFLLLLWLLGVWVLKGFRFNRSTLMVVLKNPALIAVVLGLFTLSIPQDLRTILLNSFLGTMGTIFYQAASMVGKITVPLSLIVTGAALHQSTKQKREKKRLVWAAIGGRMVLTPLLTLILLKALPILGLGISKEAMMTGFIIASMPMAVNATAISMRFGGRPSLAAGAVLYSHLLLVFFLPFWPVILQWL